MIAAEGVDSLTVPELQQAAQSRGIRIIGVSPARLRSEIEQWLDLNLKHQIPPTLLILSRAFSLTEAGPSGKPTSHEEALQATLSSLPDQVLNEAVLKMAEASASATYKQKLDVLEQQEELIADELEQEEAQAEAKRKEIEEKEAREKERESQLAASATTTTTTTTTTPGATLVGVEGHPPTIEGEVLREEEEIHLSEDQLKQLNEALSVLSVKSSVHGERQLLEDLKEDQEEFKEVKILLLIF